MDRNRYARRRTVAKKWRDTESNYINELTDLLPFSETEKDHMNKLDIIRLAKTFIYAKQLDDQLGGSLQALSKATMIMDTLDGFLLSVAQDGLILYVSDNIHRILGHYSYRMIGNNIADYVHEGDIKRFYRHLKPGTDDPEECRFLVRMNYRITKKSNKIRQAGYVGIHLSGTRKCVKSSDSKDKIGVLVAGCYIPCASPCLQPGYFESNYIMRFDKNDRLAYVENWIYDYWGVKARQFIGNHIKTGLNPADLKEWCSPWSFFHERGAIVINFTVITKAGHVFQGVTHDTMVYGANKEKLFWVGVRHVNRLGKIHIKKWPGEHDLIFVGHSYGLPGEEEKRRPINSHLEDITDSPLPETSEHFEKKSVELPSDSNKCSSKDGTLAEVNKAGQSIKDLVAYSPDLEDSTCSQDLLATDDTGLEDPIPATVHDEDSHMRDITENCEEDRDSSMITTLTDYIDSFDLTLENLDPYFEPLSDVNDTMMGLLPLVHDITPDMTEESSSDHSILGEVSLLGDDIETLSPSFIINDISEHIYNDDEQVAIASLNIDDSNGIDDFSLMETDEIPYVFAPDLVDLALQDDQETNYQTWNSINLTDKENLPHIDTTDCQITSSEDGEVTLRQLLLK